LSILRQRRAGFRLHQGDVGAVERAIDRHILPGPVLESLVSITLAELRLRPEWDPLRKDPRFQKILAGPEPKTVYQ
jgi:hypothetical protein